MQYSVFPGFTLSDCAIFCRKPLPDDLLGFGVIMQAITDMSGEVAGIDGGSKRTHFREPEQDVVDLADMLELWMGLNKCANRAGNKGQLGIIELFPERIHKLQQLLFVELVSSVDAVRFTLQPKNGLQARLGRRIRGKRKESAADGLVKESLGMTAAPEFDP